MKIAFFELFKSEQEFLGEFFLDYEVNYSEEKLTPGNVGLFKDVEIISIFTNSIIGKDIIDSLPNLKFINTSSTGYDHIDIKYCEEKGIKVSNVPSYGSITVAEFTFTLLLNLSRKINCFFNSLKKNKSFERMSSFEGFDLYGKTLGVIGTGKIGKNVIKIAKGFNMNILAYDLYQDLIFAKENNFEYKSLDELLSKSDIITIHVPYTKDNYHLINKENISKMKKGVYFINTARGELVDTLALIWGIKEGIIAGAGLDVLDDERELKQNTGILKIFKKEPRVKKDYQILINMPNVILTPHMAFYSEEAKRRITKTVEENIKGFISGNTQNLIK